MIELVSGRAARQADVLETADPELEEDPMPLRLPSASRTPDGIAWWADVPGLDPVASTGDWSLDACCAGMACAERLYGENAGRPESWLPRRPSPAERFVDWLLDAHTSEDAARRMLALRLAVNNPWPTLDIDKLLENLERLRLACTPRSR